VTETVEFSKPAVFCTVCVVMLPTTQYVMTTKCLYYNPKECPPATCNKTVIECDEPLEGRRSHCYALWTNKTGTVEILMRGCWINVENCYDQFSCVRNDMSRTEESFCCCDGDLCNAKVFDSPVTSTRMPETRTPGESLHSH